MNTSQNGTVFYKLDVPMGTRRVNLALNLGAAKSFPSTGSTRNANLDSFRSAQGTSAPVSPLNNCTRTRTDRRLSSASVASNSSVGSTRSHGSHSSLPRENISPDIQQLLRRSREANERDARLIEQSTDILAKCEEKIAAEERARTRNQYLGARRQDNQVAISRLERDNSTLEMEISERQAPTEKVNDHLFRANLALDTMRPSQSDDSAYRFGDHQARNAELEAELSALDAEIVQLQNRKSELSTELEHLLDDLDDSRGKESELNAIIQELTRIEERIGSSPRNS